MIEPTFDRRARAWLELGPTQAPADAVQAVLEAIGSVAQDRPPLRLAGRPVPASRRGLLAAAAVLAIAAVTAGAYLLRGTGPNVAATPSPRPSGHLLFDYPEARTEFERSGGPTDEAERIALPHLAGAGAWVLGAACDGAGASGLRIETYLSGLSPAVPTGGGTPPPPEPIDITDVPCDGSPVHANIGGFVGGFVDAEYDLVLAVPAGVTWRLAVGAYDGFARAPDFPAIDTPDGWYVLLDGGPMLVTGRPGPGIAVQVPGGASNVAVAVQCRGSDVTITSTVADPTIVTCDDPASVTRLAFPTDVESFDVHAGSDRVAWVRLQAQADGDVSAPRSDAPPLPSDLAGVGFVESDGRYLAFGALGSNTQALVELAEAQPGIAGGDLVAIAAPTPGGGYHLDLWSISRAEVVRTLAEVDAPQGIYESWIDATHGVVYYGVFNPDLSQAWHRVGIDGTGDAEVARTGSPLLVNAELAIDDSVFVVDACTEEGGPCTRTVVDSATGATREVALDDRTCELIGVAGGEVVARSSDTCADGDPLQLTVMALDGGAREPVVDGPGFGSAVLVASSAGPMLVYGQPLGEVGVRYSVVGLDGQGARDLASFDGDAAVAPYPTRVRLPAGDWVLLATLLGDLPANQSTGRAVPVLVNVVTSETIELVNLPHSDE